MIQFTVTFFLLLSSTFTLTVTDLNGENNVDADSTERFVRSYFASDPILIDIAWCETKFRQYEDDGSVHRGEVNTSDVGVMQINEYYHGDTAERFDIDLHSLEGNVAYAQYLYDKEGTTPWNASSHCWKDGAHLAQK